MDFEILKRVLAALEALETERVAYEDLLVTAVTPRTLYRMKVDTVRPKDRADAAAIRQQFDVGD